MSLNWNLSQIKDADTLCWVTKGEETSLNPVTEALIWYSMGIGLGCIKDKAGARAFYIRMKAKDLATGSTMLTQNDGDGPVPRPITLAEIEAHIGLATNVSNISAAKFERWLGQSIVGQATRIAAEAINASLVGGAA